MPPIRFVLSGMGLIDLFSVLPYFLPMWLPHNLLFLRVLRLFRLLRIFKLTRYSESVRIIGKAVTRIKSELLSTLMITFIVLLVSANLMYIVENEAQPDKYTDMGETLWWAVCTLTTGGYGDIYPITLVGKLISSFMAIVGIGIVAIPAGLLSSAFVKEMDERKMRKEQANQNYNCQCPSCGHKFNKE